MGITHPVSVYNAENNLEAELICVYLGNNGIEEHPMLDESLAGYWMFGTLPEIHKPQVWIDQSDVEAARPLLAEYEREVVRRRKMTPEVNTDTVDVVCEECGKTSTFPASKTGTIQDCSHCRAYIDVGDEERFDLADS
jgi:hypothetical protein